MAKPTVKGKKKPGPDPDRDAPRVAGPAKRVAAGNTFSFPDLGVTLAAGIVALGLAAAQLLVGANPGREVTLSALSQRADALQKITDPVQRDSYCVPLSAYGRSLDHALDKNARVFFSGLVGKTNAGGLGYYYFLQNYLFPRDVITSLDGHAVTTGGFFEGIPCDSPSVLQVKGFDLMIRAGANGLQLTPLTPKGTPHE
jgi:hypothetical protein